MPVQTTRKPASVPTVSLYRDDAFGGLELIEEFVMAPVADLVTAPSRLNHAGFCDYCLVRGCQSPKCVTRHASTLWAVCERCEGLGFSDDDVDPCGFCVRGVTQVTEAYSGLAVRP